MEIDFSDLKPIKNSDEKIPSIGLGTWRIGGDFIPDRTKDALWIDTLKFGIEYSIEKVGKVLIDTAELYGAGHSEELVGKAIKDFSRDKIFIVTKVRGENLEFSKVIKAAKGSLERLGVGYIDLYLVHWPNPRVPLKVTMRAMEKLVDDGIARFIGVSNFDSRLLKEARSYLSKVDIVVNQVKFSVLDRSVERGLLSFCQREKIIVMAYSPLEKGEVVNNEILRTVARKYNKTPAQIALNWLISKPYVVAIPKSEKKDRIKENLDAMGWRLELEDIKYIDENINF